VKRNNILNIGKSTKAEMVAIARNLSGAESKQEQD